MNKKEREHLTPGLQMLNKAINLLGGKESNTGRGKNLEQKQPLNLSVLDDSNSSESCHTVNAHQEQLGNEKSKCSSLTRDISQLVEKNRKLEDQMFLIEKEKHRCKVDLRGKLEASSRKITKLEKTLSSRSEEMQSMGKVVCITKAELRIQENSIMELKKTSM